MDLKDFVSETLQQIVLGVKSAQEALKDEDASINPGLLRQHGAEPGKSGLILAADDKYAQLVHFDVALQVKEGSGTKGGIGVVAGVFALGSQGQSTAESGSVSHVKFCVPITLPR